MIKDIIKMIDLEFEEFDNERRNEKNIKAFIGFKASTPTHKSVDIPIKPKFVKKLSAGKYVKPNRNSNELF
jgi:hypothetical protein